MSPVGSGGLAVWHDVLQNATAAAAEVSQVESDVSAVHYRSVVVHPAWRLLLLDSTDGVPMDRDGHGHIGPLQLRWIERQLRDAERAGQNVGLFMHQLLVDPTATELRSRSSRRGRRGSAGATSSLDPSATTEGASWITAGDMIDNREEVLSVLGRFRHVVRFSTHGHVHANTLVRHPRLGGLAFATLASATEYPVQWHELQLSRCEAALVPRAVSGVSELRRLSEQRETRPGRNRIKLGLGAAGGGGATLWMAAEPSCRPAQERGDSTAVPPPWSDRLTESSTT